MDTSNTILIFLESFKCYVVINTYEKCATWLWKYKTM